MAGNVNTITFVIIIEGKIVAEFNKYDEAYAETRRIAYTTTKTVTLTSK